MIFQTVLNWDEVFYDPQTQPRPAVAENVAGGLVELDGAGRVSRLYSTDPFLYLDESLRPGAAGPKKR